MALASELAEDFLGKDLFTEEEYFAWEEGAPGRWEFLPEGPPDALGRYLGTIRAMSGGTPDHSAIAMNLGTALSNALRGTDNRVCRVYSSDLKVRMGNGHNSYPDVSVICGAPQMYRGRRDVVTNPLLIVEVLSPSTEGYDRGDKWRGYQTIPSLQHALLVSSDRAQVEVYTRDEAVWRYQLHEGLDAQVSLTALGVTLALADIYVLVEFEDA